MGFNLKKLLEEKWADVNMFDGGRTGANVRADRNRPAPAQTPPPGGGLRVGNANSQSISLARNQQQPDVQIDKPAPVKPMAPVTVAPSTNRLMVGNTEIKSEPTATSAPAAQPKAPDRRGLASKVWDTVNVGDSGRSWGNNEVREHKSVGQNARDIGKGIVKAPAQMLNTAATQVPQVAYTVQNQLATAENSAATEEYTKAVKSRDPKRIAAAKVRMSGAVDRLDDIRLKMEAANDMFNQNEGGLFNAGTFYGADDARRGDLKTGVQKIGGGTLATAATVVPMAKGGSFVLGNNPITRQAIMRLGLEGAGYGAAYSVGDQYQNTGEIDPGRLAVDTAAGAFLNTAIPVAGRGVKNGAPKVIDYAKTQSDNLGEDGFVKNPLSGDETPNIPPEGGQTNDFLQEFTNLRKQYGNDKEFFDKVILENQEAPGKIGEFARHLAGRDATEGSLYNKNYLTEILDDELAPVNPVVDNAIASQATLNDLKQTVRDLERSTGQKGLYQSVAKNMAGMDEQQQIKYLGDALVDMRDKGVLAMDYANRQAKAAAPVPSPEAPPKPRILQIAQKAQPAESIDDIAARAPTEAVDDLRGQTPDDIIIKDRKALAKIDHELAENNRINAEVDGNAKPSTLTDRQRQQIIKKAEDDFVAGRIPAVKMEAVQNDPSRFVKDYLPSAAKKVEAAPTTKPLAKELKKETTPKAKSQAPAEEISPPASNSAESAKTSTVKLNTKRLDVPEDVAARLDKDTTEVIARLSNKEVQQAAKDAGIDFKSYGIDGTKKKIAEQLNMRNRVVTIEKQLDEARAKNAPAEEIADLIKQSAEAGRIARSQGTDVARQLQARRIIADQLATPQQKVFRLLDEAGVDPDVYSRRFTDVDMTNADEVAKAYRDLVPAHAEDWLDKFRYTNMLSSPLTHVVNITSNLSGIGGVAPVQKLVEGGVDAVKSAVTGKARTRYASEAGSYYKGVAEAIPEALETFKNVMTGKKAMEMPDVEHAVRNGKLAYDGVGGAADTILSIIPRFLEASDQAGMALTRSGELKALMKRQAKGIEVKGDIVGKAEDAALYRVFRQELGKEGQGYVLDAFDYLPNQLLKARRAKNPIVRTISKYTLPFVTTPTNLFKQGLEYSPAGIVTLAGNADKVAQVAKMTMGGATMGLAAGAFAANDAITFSEPTDKKQRDAFRAEGKQPYSIKIGNKWFSYSKTHPAIAFNFAAVAVVKDAQDKGNMTDSEADQALRMFAGVTGFFRDQSYMKAVGDFSSNIQMKDGGDAKAAIASIGSNYANQLVPFKSLTSWVGRQIDPTQRKTDTTKSAPEQIWQNIVKDIPGLNKNVPARIDPYTGEPIVNELDRHNGALPSFNALNPFKASEDKGYGKTTGLNVEQRMMMQGLPEGEKEEFRKGVLDDKGIEKEARKETEAIKRAFEQGTPLPEIKGAAHVKGESKGSTASDPTIRQLSTGKYYAKIGSEYKTFDTETAAKNAVTKEKFAASGKKYETIGDKFYYTDKNGEVKSEDVNERQTKITTAQSKLAMDSAKANNDYGTWRAAAQKQLEALHKKAEGLDPVIDEAEIASLSLTAQNLVQEMQKYNGYGGAFKKPAKGRAKGKSSNGLDYKLYGFGLDPTKQSSSLREIVKRAKVSR